jgi:hypothetical protein
MDKHKQQCLIEIKEARQLERYMQGMEDRKKLRCA